MRATRVELPSSTVIPHFVLSALVSLFENGFDSCNIIFFGYHGLVYEQLMTQRWHR